MVNFYAPFVLSSFCVSFFSASPSRDDNAAVHLSFNILFRFLNFVLAEDKPETEGDAERDI